MDGALLLKYWPLAAFALNFVAVWVLWTMRHAFASKADLRDTNERLDGLSGRVTLIEEREKLGPQAEHISELFKSIGELHSDQRELRAMFTSSQESQQQQMRSISVALDRIHDFMMKAGR